MRPLSCAPEYCATAYGRICRRDNGRPLEGFPNGNGYLRVTLSVDGKRRNLFVHHLIAEAFHGPRPDGLQLNHRNGIKTDNRPENLEYVTAKENMQHAIRTGLIVHPGPGGTLAQRRRKREQLKAAKAKAAKIKFRVNGQSELVLALQNLVRSGMSQRKIAEHLSVTQMEVWRGLHGKLSPTSRLWGRESEIRKLAAE